MTILNINNLHKAYGDKEILAGVTLHIYAGEKIGLVGANGSGKTTFLKIIVGKERADGGQVAFARDLTYGYLSQKPEPVPGATLGDFLKESRQDLFVLKERLAQIEKEMARPGIKDDKAALHSLMEKYSEFTHRLEFLDGYNFERKLLGIIHGLGFTEVELSQEMSTFSGGEKTRAQLASLLLKDHDLLILDEPTNNLDTEAMEWLEKYLHTRRGALLIVSHDRYFLDRIVHKVSILENCTLKTYKGNYSSFSRQREMEKITVEKAYKKQQQIIKKDLDFIRNASTEEIKRAQSRKKQIDKLTFVEKTNDGRRMRPQFQFAGRGSNIVLTFEKVTKSFDDVNLLKDITFRIKWGERVAIVGPNGAGKTTILRMVTGEVPPDGGSIKIGPGVKMTYFDQEHEQLDPDGTVLENIMAVSEMTEPEARNYLAAYLFRGDDVFKRALDLSGGEKSRLALAKTTLSDSNFLIMDEPTNYLDIGGIEQLEKSLSTYPGTLMLVSHDRYFISRLATAILEVKNGRATFYPHSFHAYLEMKERQLEKENVPASLDKNEARQRRLREREKEMLRRREIMARRRERRAIEAAVANLEEEIHRNEERKISLESELARPGIYDNFHEARVLVDQLGQTKEAIKDLYARWEEAAAKLEALPPEEKDP